MFGFRYLTSGEAGGEARGEMVSEAFERKRCGLELDEKQQSAVDGCEVCISEIVFESV